MDNNTIEEISIRPDGEHELDLNLYEDIEVHTNCTVIISRRVKDGKLDISWIKNEDCESYDPRTNEMI